MDGGRFTKRKPVKRRHVLAGAAASGVVGFANRIARAQSYPVRPIKLILPYTAGSPNDVIARVIGPALSARLGQPVVIENRAGGGTAIGLKSVTGADPDGYTLLFTNTPTHVIAPLVNKGFAYDPLKDFAPIVAVACTSQAMVVPDAFPANTLQEFVAYAKANPGKLNFGFGQGTLPQLVGEAFKARTQTDILGVPYRGGSQAMADMLGGRIQVIFSSIGTLIALLRDRKIKALAVTSPQRSPDLPDVPTMAESGFPELTTLTYYGFLAAAGTPAGVVERISREVNDALASPEMRQAMLKVGFEPAGGSPQDFMRLMAEQTKFWTPIVKASGFQME